MCAHGVTVATAGSTLGVELTRLPTPRRVDDTDRCDVLAEPLTLPRPGVGDELATRAEAVAIPVPGAPQRPVGWRIRGGRPARGMPWRATTRLTATQTGRIPVENMSPAGYGVTERLRRDQPRCGMNSWALVFAPWYIR